MTTYPARLKITEVKAINTGKMVEGKVKSYKSDKYLFIGDSITVGLSSTHATLNGYPARIRLRNPSKSFIVDAVGGEDISEFKADRLANVLTAITANMIQTVWLAMGTNGQVENFETDYSYVVDAMITANPVIKIYCMTPIITASYEVLTQQKRDLITAIASTRTANCTLVDGKPILTTDYLSDGVHPTDAGYEIMADYISNILNLI